MTLREMHESFQSILPGYAPACYWEPRLYQFCYETVDRPIPDELAEAAIEKGIFDALEQCRLEVFIAYERTNRVGIGLFGERYTLGYGPTRLARLHSAIVQVAQAGGFKQ